MSILLGWQEPTRKPVQAQSQGFHVTHAALLRHLIKLKEEGAVKCCFSERFQNDGSKTFGKHAFLLGHTSIWETKKRKEKKTVIRKGLPRQNLSLVCGCICARWNKWDIKIIIRQIPTYFWDFKFCRNVDLCASVSFWCACSNVLPTSPFFTSAQSSSSYTDQTTV